MFVARNTAPGSSSKTVSSNHAAINPDAEESGMPGWLSAR